MLLGLLCLLTVLQTDYARETKAELLSKLDRIIARTDVDPDEYVDWTTSLMDLQRIKDLAPIAV